MVGFVMFLCWNCMVLVSLSAEVDLCSSCRRGSARVKATYIPGGLFTQQISGMVPILQRLQHFIFINFVEITCYAW